MKKVFQLWLFLPLLWVGEVYAEPVTSGPQLLGVCQSLLGEESSYCDAITEWDIVKTVDVSRAEQPHRRRVAYEINVVEGATRYELGMTSVVTLDGLIPEGTQVRGIIVSLQKADPNDPNYDEMDALSQARHTTVASAIIGKADPLCGCPYVATPHSESMTVTLRDGQGAIVDSGDEVLVDALAYGERISAQLDVVYDLAAGIVLPGDQVRIQACVQYAIADGFDDEGDDEACFSEGGPVRSVRSCRGFDFESYASPENSTVTVKELLHPSAEDWVILNGFEALSQHERVTPYDKHFVLPGEALDFQVAASGLVGSENKINVEGDVACGDIVSCEEGAVQCFGQIKNEAILEFSDGRSPLSSAAVTEVICAPHRCTPEEIRACDDGDPCTIDSCEVGVGCVNRPMDDGDSCDGGGDLCSTGKVCQAGECVGGEPVVCPESDNSCIETMCDPSLGCVEVVKPNRSRCDDGNACTIDDICINGTCVGGSEIACDDGNPCTADSCDASGACVHEPIDGGPGSCETGDVCSQNDFCQAGECVAGDPVVCDSDGNECTSDLCVPNEGCVYPPIENDSPCGDGNLCVTGSSCQEGECVEGEPVHCGDESTCVAYACDPATGCYADFKTGPCDDGSLCTVKAECDLGECVALETLNCDDGNTCSSGTCDPEIGCVFEDLPDGVACDDGNPCTLDTTCLGGTCWAWDEEVIACDDGGNPCVDAVCLPLEGGCLLVPRDGSVCIDADNLCNEPGVCAGDTCEIGPPIDCDDGNNCTSDLCDPSTGQCYHEPTNFGDICEEADLCSTASVCGEAGICEPGIELSDCESDNPCEVAVCDGATGLCVSHPKEDGAACDDVMLCIEDGICMAGVCKPSDLAENPCESDNPCVSGSCWAGIGCEYIPRNNYPCDSGDPCTQGDMCVNGECVAGEENCDGGNPCMAYWCGPNGCESEPLPNLTACDDGNACTMGDVCMAGQCQAGELRDCAGDNSCADSACDPLTGACIESAKEDGSLCSLDDECLGCPWGEPYVLRGYRVKDAEPNPEFASNTQAMLFEWRRKPGVSNGSVKFHATQDLFFVVFDEARASLRGEVLARYPDGKEEVWRMALNFSKRGVGSAGQKGAPYLEQGTHIQSKAYSDFWEYWTLSSQSSSLRPKNDRGDSLFLLEADSTFQGLPLQLGERANGKNLLLGASVPLRWKFEDASDSFVLYLDLERVFCQEANLCQAGECQAGSVAPSCQSLDRGDYCTYKVEDFAASCRSSSNTPACLLSQNFSAIGRDLTACDNGTKLGYAFGINGYRRFGFSSASKLAQFLPPTGSSSSPSNLCDPGSDRGRPFVGDAMALDLSLRLSDLGVTPSGEGVPLGDLVFTEGPCVDVTLRELVRRAAVLASGLPVDARLCNSTDTVGKAITQVLDGFYECQGLAPGVGLPR